MHSQLLIQEMVDAVNRERDVTGAAQNRTYGTTHYGLAAGARYMIGGALVRAGRLLIGEPAPRPEPTGSAISY
jgi:hypothetical protein